MTGGVLHQGIGLQVPPFAYEPFDDLLAAAPGTAAPLLVALDGVTDPRNLGAVIRSAAAFGAQGVFLPGAPRGRHDRDRLADQRRSRGPGAGRPGDEPDPAIKACQAGGLPRGRAGRGRRRATCTTWRPRSARWWSSSAPRAAACPGWSGETCDLRVSIPMISTVESLNASVAAAVALAEVARRRSAG